jgi:hypothetical protein
VGGACAIHGTVEKSVQGLVRKPEGYHSEDRGLDGRMGPEWIVGRLARWGLCEFNWPRIGTGYGLL